MSDIENWMHKSHVIECVLWRVTFDLSRDEMDEAELVLTVVVVGAKDDNVGGLKGLTT